MTELLFSEHTHFHMFRNLDSRAFPEVSRVSPQKPKPSGRKVFHNNLRVGSTTWSRGFSRSDASIRSCSMARKSRTGPPGVRPVAFSRPFAQDAVVLDASSRQEIY